MTLCDFPGYPQISCLFLTLPIFCFYRQSVKEFERVIKEEYSGLNLFHFSRKKLKQFLVDKGMYDKEKLKLLFERAEKTADTLTTPMFVNRGTLLSFLIPLWTIVLNLIFLKQDLSLTDGVILVGCIVLLLLTLWFITKLISQLFDDFVNSDYYKLKSISDILWDFYIEM